jgi:hypothetical protein
MGASVRLVRQWRDLFGKPGHMIMTLDISHLTLLFMATVCALAMAFVWMFYEIERRVGKPIAAAARTRFGDRRD